jgi:hypothetical protein
VTIFGDPSWYHRKKKKKKSKQQPTQRCTNKWWNWISHPWLLDLCQPRMVPEAIFLTLTIAYSRKHIKKDWWLMCWWATGIFLVMSAKPQIENFYIELISKIFWSSNTKTLYDITSLAFVLVHFRHLHFTQYSLMPTTSRPISSWVSAETGFSNSYTRVCSLPLLHLHDLDVIDPPTPTC